MKKSKTKLAATPQTPVFPKSLHRLREDPKSAAANPKPQKRDNVFSKSRDTREDRGMRQLKTSHNSQSLSHGQ